MMAVMGEGQGLLLASGIAPHRALEPN
jgi:hypothetical protein